MCFEVINQDLASPLDADASYMHKKAVANYDTSLPLNPG